MANRRNFILKAAAVGATLTLSDPQRVLADTGAPSFPKSLRILVLGGTGYIGPHFLRAAETRGHKVSVLLFNRGNGKDRTDLPPGVERLMGDRNGDLEAIAGRDWDAVLDLATYVPKWVRTLGQALRARAHHYTFVSSVAAYEQPKGNQKITEHSEVVEYKGVEDPYTLTKPRDGHEYGALKVLCEREAEVQFPGRCLILRPGYIVGPGDPQGYFTYLPVRMAKGGEVLISGDRSTDVQFIDVRDLAEGSIRLIERGVTGPYNLVGPAAPTNFGELVEAARAVVSNPPEVTWVPGSWLSAQLDRDLWSKLLFWTFEPEGWAWSMRMSIDRVVARGVRFRPLRVTLAETLEWYQSQPAEGQAQLLQKMKETANGFEEESVPWQTYLDRERDLLAIWHLR